MATVPTPPEPAWMSTFCPAFRFARSTSTCQAVKPTKGMEAASSMVRFLGFFATPTGYATSESRGEKTLKNEQKRQKSGYLRENSLFADGGRSGSKGSHLGQSHPVGQGSVLEKPL